MQIFHWLFKLAHEQGRESSSTSPCTRNDRKAGSKDIISLKHCRVYSNREQTKQGSNKGLRPFRLLCRSDVRRACFYSTLTLRRLHSFENRRRWKLIRSMKMMKQEGLGKELGICQKIIDSSTNKVTPINEAPANDQPMVTAEQKKDGLKGDSKSKTKTISRMKELLRWAAAAKSDKGGKFIGRKVLKFRNRGNEKLKPVPDDGNLNDESPKISFRWETESCSTISSVYSGISMPSSTRNEQTCNSTASLSSTPIHGINHCARRRGNWITTDSEFVVLEL